MQEKILKIEEIFIDGYSDHADPFDGFSIETNLQTIKIGICGAQSCCENFGCIITNDDISEFIGVEILGVSLTDTALNKKEIPELEFSECGGVMFVNIETSNGLLQFAAYNSHNGSYGHDAVLISKQLNTNILL